MRAIPDPTIQIVARTNSLLVTAEEAQHQVIAEFVRRLDVLEPGDLPPLKLLQLRTAGWSAVAGRLTGEDSRWPLATSAPAQTQTGCVVGGGAGKWGGGAACPALIKYSLIRRPVYDFHDATILLIVHPGLGWKSTCTWLGITT